VLIGSGGRDLLLGNGGRDLLSGGRGADTLRGGAGDDILIASPTRHDADLAALDALMAEWARVLAYRSRISHLRAGGGLNDPYRLNAAAFFSDGTAVDVLSGGTGLDWCVRNYRSDRIQDKTSTEVDTKTK
jgi:Ca2+-binding RTX toxin-like protein